MSEKYITQDDIKKLLEDTVKSIKQQMKEVNTNAVKEFYSAPHPTYDRTNSFFTVVSHDPKEEYFDNGCLLTYKFSSSDVSVNPWASPWGKTYDGNPEIAFFTAFQDGYHGGPRPVKGGWSWDRTTKTESIMDLIQDGIDNLDI